MSAAINIRHNNISYQESDIFSQLNELIEIFINNYRTKRKLASFTKMVDRLESVCVPSVSPKVARFKIKSTKTVKKYISDSLEAIESGQIEVPEEIKYDVIILIERLVSILNNIIEAFELYTNKQAIDIIKAAAKNDTSVLVELQVVSYTLFAGPQIAKKIRRFPKDFQTRFSKWKANVCKDPLSVKEGIVKNFTEDGQCVLKSRIGDYRVLYTINTVARIVAIVKVDKRSEVYKNKK